MSYQDEVWKPIEDFPDYQISSFGNIIHMDRPDTLRKVSLNHKGFPTLVLFHKEHPGSRYLRQVNQLVAEAFLGPPTVKLNSVWHIDGDLTNCNVENLKWEMRSRVMEWNEMHRSGIPKYRTPAVRNNKTGKEYINAFEAALAAGDIETAIVSHIEKYPPQYADRARFQYVD